MIPRRKAIHEPKPLRIDGTTTSMTAEPDDAELAAMALLESLSPCPIPANAPTRSLSPVGRGVKKQTEPQPAEKGTVAYFHSLAERVREGRAAEVKMAMRYVAYCEQELTNHSQLTELERGLYRHLDIIDREGGELKRRWQRCLAEVIVRLNGGSEE